MLDEIIKVFKQLVLFSLLIVGLFALGAIINQYLDFTFLVSFFAVIRRLIGLFDFFIDTTTLFTLLSYALAVQVGIWIFRAYMSITQFFNSK